MDDLKPNLWGICPYIIKGAKDERITKGFVSVNNLDRDGAHSPPEAFNLERFMANPIVKYNHKYWRDKNGNEVVVGKALDIFRAEVVPVENDDEWGIRDVETKQIKDIVKKEFFPEIIAGDRGVWTKTYYTVDEVWKYIEESGVRAYSWGGLARFGVVDIVSEQRQVIIDIDLCEYSAVTIPANPKAIFVVAKSGEIVDFIPKNERNYVEMVTLGFMFSRALFKSEEDIKNWIDAKGVKIDEFKLDESNDLYRILPLTNSSFDNALTIEYDKGVQAIIDKAQVSSKGYIFGELKEGKMAVNKNKEKVDKNVERVEKAGNIVPYKKFPLADVKTRWSFEAKDGNKILDKGGWELYKQVHTWFDSSLGNVPERRYAYKLPHHKIIGDSVKTVYRGCVAAWIVTSGGRGGVDIPESDKEGVYNHLAKHIKEFGKEVPEKDLSFEEGLEFAEKLGVTKEEIEEYIKSIEGGFEMHKEDVKSIKEEKEVKEESQVKEEKKEKVEGAEYSQIKTEEGTVEYIKGEKDIPEAQENEVDAEQEVEKEEVEEITKEYIDSLVENISKSINSKLDEVITSLKAIERVLSKDKDVAEESGDGDEERVEEKQADVEATKEGEVDQEKQALLDKISELEKKLEGMERIEKKLEAMSKAVPHTTDHSDERNVTKSKRVKDDEELFENIFPISWGL